MNLLDIVDYNRVEISHEIPFMSIPADWRIKVIPPYGEATVRFFIEKNNIIISVFLDYFNIFGGTDKPYWEICPVYPHVSAYADRFMLNETEEMIDRINERFNDGKDYD